LLYPITLFCGEILDGRNRLRACEARGIEPRFEDYTGNDPLAFVVSANLKRRHLSDTQRTWIAAKISNYPMGRVRDEERGKVVSVKEAAALMNVSPRQLGRAKAVLKYGVPELIAAVDSGEILMRPAADLAVKSAEAQREALKVQPKPHDHPVGRTPTLRERDEEKGNAVTSEIDAWIDGMSNRRIDIRELSPAQRVAAAKRFICLMCASKACRSIIGAPDGSCVLPRDHRAAERGFGASKLTIPQTLPSRGKAPPPLKPQAADDDEVAAFLAAGGEIKRMPSTVNPTSEDTAALAAYHAEQEAARAAKPGFRGNKISLSD
jgi:hypothetical protein